MAEIRLQGARVGALVGKLKATGVPEHVCLPQPEAIDTQSKHDSVGNSSESGDTDGAGITTR